MSILLLFALFCISKGQILCQGNTNLYNTVGTIPSSLGPGNYADLQSCNWTIITNAPFVTIVFQTMDLEFDFDLLQFYGIPGNATPYASYSGNVLPFPIEIPTEGSLQVSFSSDYSISGIGFQFTYYVGNCKGACNNGYCVGSTCTCQPGWFGSDCSQPYCPNNCSSQGTCSINNQCVCDPGYFGGDCSLRSASFCSGTLQRPTYFVGANGTFQDHYPNDDPSAISYPANTTCYWLIRTGTSGATTIYLDQMQLETDSDEIYLYDGLSGSLLAFASSAKYPYNPILAYGPLVTVLFTTAIQEEIRYSGIQLTWSANSLCPNSCNGNGYCVGGVCRCNPGWSAVGNCANLDPGTEIPLNSTIVDTVDDLSWKYYYFVLPYHANHIQIYFNRVPLTVAPRPGWRGGFPQFYVRRNSRPDFTFYEKEAAYFDDPPFIRIGNATAGTWFFGVYGVESSGFSFQLAPISPLDVSESQSQTQGGVPLASNSGAKPSNTNTTVIIIVVVVVVAFLIVAIIVGVIRFKRYKASLAPVQPTQPAPLPRQTLKRTFSKLEEVQMADVTPK